jgi:hypothetical protein
VHALLVQAGIALATVVVHGLQAAPFPPHAVVDWPVTQLPDEQQPPLHVWVPVHEVVHAPVDVLHA